MTSADFEKWTEQYNISYIVENGIELQNIKWSKCFSSDLPRAIKTAETIFKEKIITTHLLREVPLSPVFKIPFKLPYVFWCITGRLAWLFNHKSQPETKKMTTKRILVFLDTIEHEADHNLLVVCHGFFMHAFQKELKSRGNISFRIYI